MGHDAAGSDYGHGRAGDAEIAAHVSYCPVCATEPVKYPEIDGKGLQKQPFFCLHINEMQMCSAN